jgi:hypothetical protein
MLRRFYLWLEQGAYHAICRGCQRAVTDLSGGQVELEVESTPLLEEDKVAESPSEPAKRTVKKKRATRK